MNTAKEDKHSTTSMLKHSFDCNLLFYPSIEWNDRQTIRQYNAAKEKDEAHKNRANSHQAHGATMRKRKNEEYLNKMRCLIKWHGRSFSICSNNTLANFCLFRLLKICWFDEITKKKFVFMHGYRRYHNRCAQFCSTVHRYKCGKIGSLDSFQSALALWPNCKLLTGSNVIVSFSMLNHNLMRI